MKMKKINPLEIFILMIVCLFISWIKALNSMYFSLLNSSAVFLYNIYVCPADDLILNIFWSSIIFLQLFIACKNSYYKLINFEVRNKNRSKNTKSVLFDHLLFLFIYCMISTFIQYVFIKKYINISLCCSLEVINVFLKYYIELLVMSFSILLLAIIMKNFTYSFIIHLVIYYILVKSCKYTFIPFFSLYVNSEINIFSIISILAYWFLIRLICKKIEFFGGVDK